MLSITTQEGRTTRLIAYTYDAAIHCVSCAVKAHGMHPSKATDSEGNPVHAILDHEEIAEREEGCDTCGCPIE